MNNQDTNQTVLNSTSQDTKQPEAVAPVTNDQATPVTPAVDTKPANSSDTTASTPVAPTAPTVPDTVKLELLADQAEMIQTLLNDYVLAYRSDRSVDYKPEPVPREKVGQYPYVATAPAPEIINPTYDWINKKWYSKNGTQSLPVIAENVADLSRKSAEQDQVALENGYQMQMITQQVGVQTKQSQEILQVMGQLQKAVAILVNGNQAQTTAPTQPTTDNKQTLNAKTTNGGNN